MKRSVWFTLGLGGVAIAILGGGDAGPRGRSSAAELREALAANRAANASFVRAMTVELEDQPVALGEVAGSKRAILGRLRRLDAAYLDEIRIAAISSLEADLHLIEAELTVIRAAAAGASGPQLGWMDNDLERLRRASAVRHARLDELAVRRGLLPYRTASPF